MTPSPNKMGNCSDYVLPTISDANLLSCAYAPPHLPHRSILVSYFTYRHDEGLILQSSVASMPWCILSLVMRGSRVYFRHAEMSIIVAACRKNAQRSTRDGWCLLCKRCRVCRAFGCFSSVAECATLLNQLPAVGHFDLCLFVATCFVDGEEDTDIQVCLTDSVRRQAYSNENLVLFQPSSV